MCHIYYDLDISYIYFGRQNLFLSFVIVLNGSFPTLSHLYLTHFETMYNKI